jgi:predicted transcriptional regulator
MAEDTIDLRELVAEVAAAYFSNSNVNPNDIPQVIAQIASSLAAISEGASSAEPADAAPAAPKLTAAQIRKSITPSALISFEDGRPYKTLRRHLTVKGLTPEAYREKWGLPRDYPLVAADYSASRSQLAKNLGLGRKGATARGRGGRAKKV